MVMENGCRAGGIFDLNAMNVDDNCNVAMAMAAIFWQEASERSGALSYLWAVRGCVAGPAGRASKKSTWNFTLQGLAG